MVHTPSTRLNDPLWCSQGAAAIPLKPCWALRFGVVLGVLGVRCFEGCWAVGGLLEGVSGLESGLLIWVLCLLSVGFWAVRAG